MDKLHAVRTGTAETVQFWCGRQAQRGEPMRPQRPDQICPDCRAALTFATGAEVTQGR